MSDCEVPDGLANALRGVGAHPVGPADPDGRRWRVRTDDGDEALVTVVPASVGSGAAVRRRVATLAPVRHDHLPAVGPVLTLPAGATAVLQQHVPGDSLETVQAARGPWSPGEVVTTLVPLAGALAVLHDAGLTHGAVTARDVVLAPDGRAVLVGLMALGAGDAAAPDGDGAAGDVAALGRLGMSLLGLGSPPGRRTGLHRTPVSTTEADGPSASAARLNLLRVLDEAVHPITAGHPTASELAGALYRACPPVPVSLPDAAVLAGESLRGGAIGITGRTARARHRSVVPVRRRVVQGAVGVLAVAVCVVAVAASIAGGGVRSGAAEHSGPTDSAGLASPAQALEPAVVAPGEPSSQSEPSSRGQSSDPDSRRDRSDLDDPVGAAMELTRARVEALAAGDIDALRAVTVPGSPAARNDEVATRALAGPADSRGRVSLRFEIAEEVPWEAVPGVADPCRECVAVRLRSAAAVAVSNGSGPASRDGDEADVEDASSGPGGATTPVEARDVVLVLVPTGDGWRVSEVGAYVP